MATSKITGLSSYFPARTVTNDELEGILNSEKHIINKGTIKEKFGITERRYAEEGEQASDLAVKAARKIVGEYEINTIDCIIFAAGSSDMIEPATASIIQSKLKLHCPAFDIKNACNSFVCGLQTAHALIVSDTYNKILLLCGEKVSAIIKFQYEDNDEFIKRFASLSMGDAGAAAIIEKSQYSSGMMAQRFQTNGEYWDLCTVPGGGSMYPHDGSKVYFEGRTSEMRKIFFEKKGDIISKTLREVNWSEADLDWVFMHHVSMDTFAMVARDLNISQNKFYHIFERFGNMAAASIPAALSDASQQKLLKKGDKIMLLGLASGISISVQLVIW